MPPRKKRAAGPAKANSPARTGPPVVPERPTLADAPVEIQQQILGLVLREGGISAAFEVARSCRSLLLAFRGLPLWKGVCDKHKFKQRSKKLPFDERLVVEKLQEKQKHLCHNLECLALTKVGYFVPTGPKTAMRLCLPCLGNLWEGNRWIRDRSYASPEWDEALQRELREEFFNKTELRSTGLKKDQIDGIAHIRWFHQNNAHSRGSFSYEYKPTDVLLARWQIYGGQTGLDAKSAYEGEQANHDSGAEKSAYEGEQQTTIPAGYILKLPERRPRGMDRVVNGLFIGDLDEFADLEL